MKSLPTATKSEFQEKAVLSKTNGKFSAIPLDQAHEQENKFVKDDGGAVGLTENPTALRCIATIAFCYSKPRNSYTTNSFYK